MGHHSEGRHRRDLERLHEGMAKGFDAQAKAEHHARRAEGIRRWEQERLSAPVTIRRIAKLEAERRRVERALKACERLVEVPGARMEALRADLQDLVEELAYWRGTLYYLG